MQGEGNVRRQVSCRVRREIYTQAHVGQFFEVPPKVYCRPLLRVEVTIALQPRQLTHCRLDIKFDSRSLTMYNMHKIEYVEESGTE